MSKFTEEEIRKIYETKVKLPPSYFKKYEYLPPYSAKQFEYDWSNYNFPRNWTSLDFIEWTKTRNIDNVDHLGST